MTDYSRPTRLVWMEPLKAFALAWVFVNHVVERLFGTPYIGNPGADWPPLADRLAQLHPLTGYGGWTLPINLLRYAGWAGDQGVQLFIIVSGLGLTWGLLARDTKQFAPLGFYRRRFARLYPEWWGAHALFGLAWLLTGWGLPLTSRATYLSALGLRFTPSLFYYFSPAWWYFCLLLQLYLVYPLLWAALQRFGPARLLLVGCVLGFAARGVGLSSFGGYVDAWQRGAVFITRLPEFVFGICLAVWLRRDPAQTERQLQSPATLLIALASYVAGTALSISLPGMIVAPFLLGISAFVLLYSGWHALKRTRLPGARLGDWIGRHSYSLYLMHHPFVALLVPLGLAASARRTLAGLGATLLLTLAAAVTLEWVVAVVSSVLRRWRARAGLAGTARRVAASLLVALSLLWAGELAVRQFAPQEVLGWGERPSLVPDDQVGWRLKPSTTTRLRWESYDYIVTANALGFPGPDYTEPKPPGVLRILVTGDAFTSAEGVNTVQAWPRLLEAELAARLAGRRIEVLNFAITGYGPNQYAAVVTQFAPRFKPDLIVVQMFVNDYQDALLSADEFRQSIGFGQPDPGGAEAFLRLEQLRRFLHLELAEPVRAFFLGQPEPEGYFLGNFAALERNWPEWEAAREVVAGRLAEIKATADRVGARMLIVMVPASVQVCAPNQLAYFPAHVDLADASRFDLDLPQRLTRDLAQELGLQYDDLRPELRAASACPYQPRNMHWTAAGHHLVAAHVAAAIIAAPMLFAGDQ